MSVTISISTGRNCRLTLKHLARPRRRKRSRTVSGLPLRGLSTPGQGQGEGPFGSKLSRRDDADDDGRGRSERR